MIKNTIAAILQTAFSNHPIFTLLAVFIVPISLLFLTVFILIKNGSITMSIDFKNQKIELNIVKQSASSVP